MRIAFIAVMLFLGICFINAAPSLAAGEGTHASSGETTTDGGHSPEDAVSAVTEDTQRQLQDMMESKSNQGCKIGSQVSAGCCYSLGLPRILQCPCPRCGASSSQEDTQRQLQDMIDSENNQRGGTSKLCTCKRFRHPHPWTIHKFDGPGIMMDNQN